MALGTKLISLQEKDDEKGILQDKVSSASCRVGIHVDGGTCTFARSTSPHEILPNRYYYVRTLSVVLTNCGFLTTVEYFPHQSLATCLVNRIEPGGRYDLDTTLTVTFSFLCFFSFLFSFLSFSLA